MTAKLIPFSYNVGTIYNGFFNRHVYQPTPSPPPLPPFLLHHHQVAGSKKSSVWIRIFNSVFLERLETAVEVKLDNSATSYFLIVAWPSLFLSLNIFRFSYDENSCKKPGGTSSNALHIPLGLEGISSIAGYQT